MNKLERRLAYEKTVWRSKVKEAEKARYAKEDFEDELKAEKLNTSSALTGEQSGKE